MNQEFQPYPAPHNNFLTGLDQALLLPHNKKHQLVMSLQATQACQNA